MKLGSILPLEHRSHTALSELVESKVCRKLFLTDFIWGGGKEVQEWGRKGKRGREGGREGGREREEGREGGREG